MTNFTLPLQKDISNANKLILEHFVKTAGFIPNIYKVMAYSETALATFIKFSNTVKSLSKRETELINLVISQENECQYSLCAHTFFGKMNGYSDQQIMEIRKGKASFDLKLNALAIITKEIALNKGRPTDETLKTFYKAGYSKENLIDLLLAMCAIMCTNFLNNLANIPIDFPDVP
ncbi:MAG: carboxymuconolactone decarboxylase family protein [Chitinophagaceae bacterium]